MAEEVDFWTPTVEAFAPLQLPSPELTPKLLKRPPFRFIHDIVTAINARFGAYDHIFTPEQLNAALVDSKEKKIEFLTTLKEYVSTLLSKKIDLNPKKVASGHEPEKTNVFLQCVALAVGYAQQDKAKQAQQVSAPPPPPPPPLSAPPLSSSAANEPPSGFPDTASLPRQRSRAASVAEENAMRNAALAHAHAFNQKIAGFSLNLRLDEKPDIVADNKQIVKMWEELEQQPADTRPPQMPAEALETAIDRQLAVIKQVHDLDSESNTVIQEIENLLL